MHVELGLVATTTNHNRPSGSKWTWNLYLGDMATYILCLGLFLFHFLARSHWQHTTHRPLSDAPHRWVCNYLWHTTTPLPFKWGQESKEMCSMIAGNRACVASNLARLFVSPGHFPTAIRVYTFIMLSKKAISDYRQSNARTNKWNKRASEQTDERTHKHHNKRMNEHTNGRTNIQMNERMNKQVNAQTNKWMSNQTHGQTNEQMNTRMNAPTN